MTFGIRIFCRERDISDAWKQNLGFNNLLPLLVYAAQTSNGETDGIHILALDQNRIVEDIPVTDIVREMFFRLGFEFICKYEAIQTGVAPCFRRIVTNHACARVGLHQRDYWRTFNEAKETFVAPAASHMLVNAWGDLFAILFNGESNPVAQLLEAAKILDIAAVMDPPQRDTDVDRSLADLARWLECELRMHLHKTNHEISLTPEQRT